MNHNFSQITNFNIPSGAAIENIPVKFGDGTEKSIPYYVLSHADLTGSASSAKRVYKVGYVCEPRGTDYPVVIVTSNIAVPDRQDFYLGNTGIFEAMTETFQNMEDPESETITCTLEITTIKVPKGPDGEENIKFKLDYAYVD